MLFGEARALGKCTRVRRNCKNASLPNATGEHLVMRMCRLHVQGDVASIRAV